MNDSNTICDDIKYIVSSDGELKALCRKHYCLCLDKYVWDTNLDNKYQEAKRQGKAHSGKFLNK